MQKSQLKKYLDRLEQERGELQALLARNGQATRSDESSGPDDEAGKAAQAYNKEFLFSQSDSERSHLQLVTEAIDRIKKGEFGLCQSCDELIEEKRLDAVPWTPYCRACQELVEEGVLGTNDEVPL